MEGGVKIDEESDQNNDYGNTKNPDKIREFRR